jgi:hypothetical protein
LSRCASRPILAATPSLFGKGLEMNRFSRALPAIGVAILTWAGQGPFAFADGDPGFDPAVRPAFSEPVVLASKDGVLEVRLIAKQGEVHLDTVATPVKNALVFGYELIRGTASNGKMSGDSPYPAPTLQVFPGETLIIHLDNALTGLTIKDYELVRPSPQATNMGGQASRHRGLGGRFAAECAWRRLRG